MGIAPIFYLCRGKFMQLAELVEKSVAGLGYELVDLDMSPRARLIRIFIDKPEGIGVDDCAAVSNHLTRLFTVENIDYDRLEVSSPGLDRPLKKLADFERFVGQQAQVRIRVAIANQRNFSGVIAAVRETKILLSTEKGELELDFDQIDKAHLVPKF